MQTFMPYHSFHKSLSCLDDKRLGKQRVEAMQILKVLERGRTGAWRNHPAVKMWEHYEEALKLYYNMSLMIWKQRGFQNRLLTPLDNLTIITYPSWIFDNRVLDSHRSNLIRKNPDHYGKLWNISNDLPYYWPIR